VAASLQVMPVALGERGGEAASKCLMVLTSEAIWEEVYRAQVGLQSPLLKQVLHRCCSRQAVHV
jgi:hypothetical protein